MDITPQDNTQQSISDDQELAKALAGVVPEVAEPAPLPTPPALEQAASTVENTEVPELPTLDFEETPGPVPSPEPADVAPVEAGTVAAPSPVVTSTNGDLDAIKKDALQELRPLMDKVDLPPEEKFDTYLMLLRSTDDSSLIAPAHTAALAISDEKRKATALLDVIKEIDYLSQPSQPKQAQ